MVEPFLSRIIVERWHVADTAAAAGVNDRCADTWLARFRAGGERMLRDRSAAGRKLIGWEARHVAMDDASRLAYTAVLPDETMGSATAVTAAAPAFFARHGVAAERVIPRNLPVREAPYRPPRSRNPNEDGGVCGEIRFYEATRTMETDTGWKTQRKME